MEEAVGGAAGGSGGWRRRHGRRRGGRRGRHGENGEDDAESDEGREGEGEEADEADAAGLQVEALAARAHTAAPCCVLSIGAEASVYELKRKVRRALASVAAHPPHMPAASRIRSSLSSSRLRLYRRAGSRLGCVLRDEQPVGGATAAAVGGAAAPPAAPALRHFAFAADAEIAVHLLEAEERLAPDSVLIGCVVLDVRRRAL